MQAILDLLIQGPMTVAEIKEATGYGKGKVDYALRLLVAGDEAHCCGLRKSGHRGQRRKIYAWGPNPNPAPEHDEGWADVAQAAPEPIPAPALHPMLAWGMAA